MRLIYQPQNTMELIADGRWLIQYDGQNQEVSYISLDSTPLHFLLKPQVSFQSHANVHNVVRGPKWTQIVISSKQDPEAGFVTLVFQENPLQLVRWIIREPQGNQTILHEGK